MIKKRYFFNCFSGKGMILYTAILIAFNYFHVNAQQNDFFKPNSVWPDNKGEHINAHGGGILFYNGKYYWFGEYKIAGRSGNSAQVGVSCYSSTNLYNWQNKSIALEVSGDTTSEIRKGCIIERPKVVYNTRTHKFVMWFHLEHKGKGYSAALTAVAIADKPEGPYNFVRSYRPNERTWPIHFPEHWKQANPEYDTLKWWTDKWRKAVAGGLFIRKHYELGQMARDMTIFVDEDGKAYNIHASEENLTLHISELSDDYLSFTGKWTSVFPGGHNEAPAICKHNGKYYLITSGCTGWEPNAARSAVANSIWGPWENLGNPCIGEGAEKTFLGQGTYILKIDGIENGYIFMADRWAPRNPIDGTYIWLPIKFEEGRPIIRWFDKWDLNIFTKTATN